ncbi:MAG: 23S rRNA pseudouridine synthase F [Clostridiales bacterium 38-18]|nr:MAG: 23S rRNA pseudouridine synthase F [Clostridiales bacterium 38-18]
MRINNYISASGYCSRRKADELILQKKVKINGRVASIGDQVGEKDRVEVDGKRIGQKKKHVYIAFNKPEGVICTTERHIKNNIIDFIGYEERIFPIGRLDKDSEGLILLTSDGSIVNEVLRAENGHEKEYRVTLNHAFDADFLEQMQSGVVIFNPVKKKHEKTLPCKIQKSDATTFSIILSQGLNRQIRRMSEALGYEVVKLKRVRFLNIKLGNLKLGHYRPLSDEEVKNLLNKKNK